MESFSLISSSGKPYKIRLPEPHKNQRSAYIFAFPKSGSTLIQDMVKLYCTGIEVPTFSLYDSAFRQGIPTEQIQADATKCLKKDGYIYTGFRHFPDFDIDLKGSPTILLVRDPRDMLVSFYYSVRTSHIIPNSIKNLQEQRRKAGGMDIDRFVLERRGLYKRIFQHYQRALFDTELTTYRYEDVIYDKEEWLGDVIRQLGLKVSPILISSVSSRFDIYPDQEDESSHIRQVHPGNYQDKLARSTIDKLNEYYRTFLDCYGYEF